MLPVAAFYRDAATGAAAIEAVLGNGVAVAALEFLDAGSLAAAGGAFPSRVPLEAGFMVIAEADGSSDETLRIRADAAGGLKESALAIVSPTSASEVAALWRFRDGVSHAVTAQRGGKVSEDIVVPVDRLLEAIDRLTRAA